MVSTITTQIPSNVYISFCKLCKRYQTNRYNYDFLLSECVLSYYKAKNNYKKHKGTSFKTWCLLIARNRLFDVIYKSKQHIEIDNIKHPVTNYKYPFEILMVFNKDELFVVNKIFKNPHKYLSVTPKKARGIIANELIKKHKWKHARTWNVIRSIKSKIRYL